MITKIYAKNFKGMYINRDVSQKTLLLGRNSTGKTAHADALKLALMGYIPGKTKKIDQLFDIYATDPDASIEIGFEVDNNKLFERSITKKDGSVSQYFTVDGRPVTAKKFITLIGEAGNPTIFDLNTFFELSDRKRVDFIFDLYPPDGDVSEIEREISKTQTEIEQARTRITQNNATIKRLEVAIQNRALPEGNLPETEIEITRVKEEIKLVRKNIRDKEIEEARQNALKFAPRESAPAETALPPPDDIPIPTEDRTTFRFVDAGTTQKEPDKPSLSLKINEAIKAIENAAVKIGCASTCVLLMVAKREILKVRK